MIILKVILWIVMIAFIAGVLAFIAEIFHKRDGDHKPNGMYERYLKRPLDAFLATGASIVLSPVLLITAILVRVKLGSPVLFRQERPGRDEKIFKLYKFRTMTDARNEKGELLPDEQRLPAFGRKLRSTSLDELPELTAFADRLGKATLQTIAEGEMTGDLARITEKKEVKVLNSLEFIQAIAKRL